MYGRKLLFLIPVLKTASRFFSVATVAKFTHPLEVQLPWLFPHQSCVLARVHATKTIGTAVQARLGLPRPGLPATTYVQRPRLLAMALAPYNELAYANRLGLPKLFFSLPLPLVWHGPGSLVLRVSQPSSPVHFHLDHLEFSFLHPLFTSQRFLISFANIDLPRSTSWARKKLTNLKFRPCSNGRLVPCRTMSTTPPTNPIPMTYSEYMISLSLVLCQHTSFVPLTIPLGPPGHESRCNTQLFRTMLYPPFM
jgi:hypothetical protein